MLVTLNLLDSWASSRSDAARAASTAFWSDDVAVVVPAPASSAEDRETAASLLRRPCWSEVRVSSVLRSVDSFGDTAEGSGCIKRVEVSYGISLDRARFFWVSRCAFGRTRVCGVGLLFKTKETE